MSQSSTFRHGVKSKKQYMTVAEVCRYLGLPRRKVYRWIRLGKVRHGYGTIGGRDNVLIVNVGHLRRRVGLCGPKRRLPKNPLL